MTALRVYPVLLDQVILPAEIHVGLRISGGGVGGSKGPSALVCYLVPIGVIPGCRSGVGDRFLCFVRDYTGHSVRARIRIRADGLFGTLAQEARLRVPHKSI